MKYPSLQDRPNECDELDGEEERTKRLSNEYQDVSRCVKMCQDVSRCLPKRLGDFQFETLQSVLSVLKHELSRIWYFGSRQDLNYQDAVKFGLKSGEVGQNVGRWSEQSICFCQKSLWISAIFEAS